MVGVEELLMVVIAAAVYMSKFKLHKDFLLAEMHKSLFYSVENNNVSALWLGRVLIERDL